MEAKEIAPTEKTEEPGKLKKAYQPPALNVLGTVEKLTGTPGYPGGGCGCTSVV